MKYYLYLYFCTTIKYKIKKFFSNWTGLISGTTIVNLKIHFVRNSPFLEEDIFLVVLIKWNFEHAAEGDFIYAIIVQMIFYDM